MEHVGQWISTVDSWVWGLWMIVLLVGTGVYLTARLRLIQARLFIHGFRAIRGDFDSPDDKGDISHFRTLAAVLSATVGTGNIAGVATAIAAGGPGALVWMWLTAVVGMTTKYAESLLADRYRVFRPDGSAAGGPMYVLERGLGWR
jgi:alanine or glycine:cation symporter, AGCS family